jgi:cytochrome c-type biogenesis protein CcmH
MTLWIVLTLMAVFSAVGLTIPVVRHLDRKAARRTTTEALEISPEAPDIQGADVMPPPPALRRLAPFAIGGGAVLIVVSILLYATLVSSGLPGRPVPGASPGMNPTASAAHSDSEVASMIAGLETRMKQTPNNPEGWRMLAWSYARTGRNVDAAEAYGRAARLDPANAEYASAQGEALTLAAGGSVTEAAQTAFRKALAADRADPRARYFLAVRKDQDGDHKGAMDDWVSLINSAPEGAPWVMEVRTFVERTARERGEDISRRLPAGPAMSSTALPIGVPLKGPTAEQVAAAGKASPGDQQRMIAGMVDGLAQRLKDNPRDQDGWARLMRARMVLGQTDAAQGALKDGLKAFSGSPAEQNALRRSAREIGVPGV